jgi:DNA polymerase-3 subunit delta
MNRDATSIIKRIKSSSTPRVALVLGDPLQVQEACNAIVETLVPAADRSFNLERLDARNVAWDRIESALLTPPFLPGSKVVWIENVSYFYTREQRGELGGKIIDQWRDGKRDDAAKLLRDLLVGEGWTQERWDELDAVGVGLIAEFFDLDESANRTDVEALIAHARTRGVIFGAPAGAEGHRLAEMLDRGLPEWDFLLLTAVQVDRRTSLFKRFEEMGAVLFLGLERDRFGKVTREGLLEFITARVKDAEKILEPAAREMILARAANDLGTLNQELEKLCLYTGDRSTITAKDVDLMFLDQGEGWIFDFTRAVSERNAAAALGQLARLLAQGDHPLRLLATIASEIRRLMAARQSLDGEWRGVWRSGMSYQQFQDALRRLNVSTRNPYGDYMNFQRAERFSMNELRAQMESVFYADLRLKSSGTQSRMVMEQLLLGMCLGSKRKRRMADARIHV